MLFSRSGRHDPDGRPHAFETVSRLNCVTVDDFMLMRSGLETAKLTNCVDEMIVQTSVLQKRMTEPQFSSISGESGFVCRDKRRSVTHLLRASNSMHLMQRSQDGPPRS
jgi:PP-loop superfamily ATP-utilizing enzyme